MDKIVKEPMMEKKLGAIIDQKLDRNNQSVIIC